jgi:hypothetical protein
MKNFKKKLEEVFDRLNPAQSNVDRQNTIERIEATISLTAVKNVEDAIKAAINTLEDKDQYDPIDLHMYFDDVVERVVNHLI